MDKRIKVDSQKVYFSYKKGGPSITNDDVIKNGNRMMCGNGLIGYRGTVEETRKEGMCATIVNGIYDKRGNAWREPVNFPNGLFCSIQIVESEDDEIQFDGDPFSIVENDSLLTHVQSIDYRYGLFSRNSVFKKDVTIRIHSERFVSMADSSLLCCRYSVCADKRIDLAVLHGIDCDVYDINGPHFDKKLNVQLGDKSNFIVVEGTTLEKEIPFGIVHKSVNPEKVLKKGKLSSNYKELLVDYITLDPNKEETWYFFETIKTDLPNKCEISSELQYSSDFYQDCWKKHCDKWDEIWNTGDVIIEGDEEAQNELRYSLYQLQIIAPPKQDKKRPLSVPARGLSGQTYKGAVFWDTEMFISPYFLYTRPEIVRNFIEYRILTLEGAKEKAKHYGFEGTFYAWESQESGEDACSDYNVVDVFTGRPQKTYFRDKQIHISGDIVYAIVEYIDSTNDYSILVDGAFEVILECAKFYLTAVVYIPCKNRYELHDVIGPDEYHERVDNNAYTNRIAKHTLDSAIRFIDYLKKENPAFLVQIYQKTDFINYEKLLHDVFTHLYIPSPNEEGIIEQFDGYFNLEDCSLQDVRSRLLNPKEYWGGANGVASQTRIIKQADVILSLNMFPDDYSDQVKKANFEFYEPRTEHGSSLSPCMYALISCKTGNSDWGYPFFRKTAGIDISADSKQFAGLVYIGGTHPAASGGAWISVVKGFCGFSVKDSEPQFKPKLPESWQKVQFNIIVQNKKYQVSITKEGIQYE